MAVCIYTGLFHKRVYPHRVYLELLQAGVVTSEATEARHVHHKGDLLGYLFELNDVSIDVLDALAGKDGHLQRASGSYEIDCTMRRRQYRWLRDQKLHQHFHHAAASLG